MYKCVIFDLDGTILNTLDDLANAGNYALEVQGFPTHETEKYKYFVGNGIPMLVKRMLPDDISDDVRQKTYDIFCSYYSEHMNDYTKPYEGIIDLLTFLNISKIKIIVVTNKADNFAKEIIKKHFGDLISDIYGSVSGFPKKPDPYWVNVAIKNSGFEKSEVLYVGDSSVDMETAKNAGLISCGVLWGFRGREELIKSGCNHICSTCEDIRHIIFSS